MAAAQLGSFEPISPLNGVYAATKGSLRCSAVRLKDNGVGLFSPVAGLGEQSLASLETIGEVAFLVAPNHYHNKALREYADAFPQATLCAPSEAQPRLAKVTSLAFDDLRMLENALPKRLSIVPTQGLKTGEIWLRVKQPDFCAWLVVDAFGGAQPAATTDTVAAPSMLGTFPKMGVADADRYKAWVLAQIEQDKPDLVMPCHGAPFRSRNLPKQLAALVSEKL